MYIWRKQMKNTIRNLYVRNPEDKSVLDSDLALCCDINIK